MTDTSPEWKKPADVLKFRRRKRLSTNLNTTRTAAPSGRLSLETCQPARVTKKRRNPFAKTIDDDKDTEIGASDGVAEVKMNRVEAANSIIDVLVSCCVV